METESIYLWPNSPTTHADPSGMKPDLLKLFLEYEVCMTTFDVFDWGGLVVGQRASQGLKRAALDIGFAFAFPGPGSVFGISSAWKDYGDFKYGLANDPTESHTLIEDLGAIEYTRTAKNPTKEGIQDAYARWGNVEDSAALATAIYSIASTIGNIRTTATPGDFRFSDGQYFTSDARGSREIIDNTVTIVEKTKSLSNNNKNSNQTVAATTYAENTNRMTSIQNKTATNFMQMQQNRTMSSSTANIGNIWKSAVSKVTNFWSKVKSWF